MKMAKVGIVMGSDSDMPVMKKAADVMGVELNAAPHSARKTYAVEVFQDRGLDAAQKELQHDRLSTTMLYAFSDILSQDCNKMSQNLQSSINLEEFAELIANKVVKKLHNY